VQGYDLNKLAASFDRVAKYFDIVYPLFIGPYRRAVDYVLRQLPDHRATPRVLDIGTGTGTLAGAFAAKGAEVTGVDISAGMLEKARRKYGSRVTFIKTPAHALDGFADNSFEVVAAAFVLHEMPPAYRVKILREMKRLAGSVVMAVDYIPNLNPVISLVERVEKSYYRDFLKNVGQQLVGEFSDYKLIRLTHFMGLYLCDPRA